MSADKRGGALKEQGAGRADAHEPPEPFGAGGAPAVQASDDTADADEFADVEEGGDDSTSERASRGRVRGAASGRLIDSLPASPQFWNVAVVVCLSAAVVLLLTGHTDATFVLATLGLVAWFINMRNRLRGDDVQAHDDDAEGDDRGETLPDEREKDKGSFTGHE